MSRLKTLDLGGGLVLPLDAVTRAMRTTGQRGTGKTSTAVVTAEEAHAAGCPSVIVDPTDAWWGLRSSADGKGEGLGHIVFGGDHGHLPLREDSGAVMARLVVEQRLSAVFSLKKMRKSGQVRFVAEFLEELYHLNREPLLVVIDEAHRFCPQQALEKGGFVQRAIGAVIDIATLGRVNGLGIVLITQRLAKLHKDVVEACEIMLIHRLLGPNDRKTIEAWLKDAGQEDEAAELGRKLPKLKRGQCLAYAPDLDILGEFTIRPKRTFDSSGTPEVGSTKVEPKSVADVDLSAIEALIGDTIEEAKAEDPAHLRRKIAELERALRDRPDVEPEVETVEVEVIPAQWGELVREAVTQVGLALEGALGDLADFAERYPHEYPPAAAPQNRALPPRPVPTPVPAPAPRAAPEAPRSAPQTNGSAPTGDDTPLGKAERAIVSVLATYGPVSKRRLAMQAGYSMKGGGFNNALGSLRSRGYIPGRGEPIALADGIHVEADPLPTGRALFEHWLTTVGKAEREVLEVLAGAYPTPLSKEEVAERTASGYAPTGGGFNNALGKLRTLQLIDGQGYGILLDETLGAAASQR